MDLLMTLLRDHVPSSASQKWAYEIDISHSCFGIEHTSMERVVLSGLGNESLDDMMVRVEVNFRVGKSRHVRRVVLKKKGARAAITTLFRFPENHAVCCECGDLKTTEDGRAHCESCLFLEVYSGIKRDGGPPETCSICQEEAFRTVLPCGHVFHMTCLLSMNPHRLRCPNCRDPLPPGMIRQMFGACCDCAEDDEDDDDEEDEEEDF